MYLNEQDINSAQLRCLDWSAIQSLKEGETRCGDAYMVREHHNKILIAVIDGLGHGPKAAQASDRAVELLEQYHHQSLINLVKDCHNGLRNTRGVVMNLALINFTEHTLAWIGVGNVEGILLMANENKLNHTERIIQRSGIVGYNLPLLQVSMFPISFGDVLIFATDGVQSNFLEKVNLENTPGQIVHESSTCFKTSDDALVLAAKYKGKSSYEH